MQQRAESRRLERRIIFTGFSGNGKYAGTMTFREAHQMPDGTLVFGRAGV